MMRPACRSCDTHPRGLVRSSDRLMTPEMNCVTMAPTSFQSCAANCWMLTWWEPSAGTRDARSAATHTHTACADQCVGACDRDVNVGCFNNGTCCVPLQDLSVFVFHACHNTVCLNSECKHWILDIVTK